MTSLASSNLSSNSTTNVAKSSSILPWPPGDGHANVCPPDWSGMLADAIEPLSAQQLDPMRPGPFNSNVLPQPTVQNAPSSQISFRNAAAQVAHPSWPMMHANSMQPLPQQLDSISPSNLTMALVPSNDFSKGNNYMLGHASKVQDLHEDQSHPANDGPRKRVRKRKTVPADVKEAKRKEFLERNRVAANRCRQKRKEWIHTLENNRVTLQQDNAVKQIEKQQLEWQINT